MKDTITTNIKLKVIPLCKGVTIEKVTEDKENLIIELKFKTECDDVSNYLYLINNVNGKCVVSINKDLFIKNNYSSKDKNFISFQTDKDLSILTKSAIMDILTYFKCKFVQN